MQGIFYHDFQLGLLLDELLLVLLDFHTAIAVQLTFFIMVSKLPFFVIFVLHQILLINHLLKSGLAIMIHVLPDLSCLFHRFQQSAGCILSHLTIILWLPTVLARPRGVVLLVVLPPIVAVYERHMQTLLLKIEINLSYNILIITFY
jgi:hypothetical protein